MERKKLYVISLYIFLIGNILTYFSPNFTFMMIARILTAMSTALVVVLSLTIAAKIVPSLLPSKSIRINLYGY
ncbi:MFS transporter [Bacillus cereus]